MRPTKAVILAAGKGTRMGSDLPKVLHPVGGTPMIVHCVRAARDAGVGELVLVVGHGRELVAEAVAGLRGPNGGHRDGIAFAVQAEQLGTGHAVIQARPFLEGFDGNVAVLYGDMPLLSAATIAEVVGRRDATGAAAVVLTVELDNPPDFGRIVRDEAGLVAGIVEVRDARREELAIREVNVGAYCFDNAALLDALDRLRADNAQGEYYLTDVIGMMAGDGRLVETVVTQNLEETLGINDPVHLAFAEKLADIRHAEALYDLVDAALAMERERGREPEGPVSGPG